MRILGTAQLTRPYGVVRRREDASDVEAAASFVSLAADLGFDALDTAPSYGDAELAIGLSGVSLPVHTKLDPAADPTVSLEASRLRLQRTFIDVLYIHDSRLVLSDSHDVIETARSWVGDTIGALGISLYTEEEFDAAVSDGRFGVIQLPFSLADRRFDADRLSKATDRGIRIFARSVLLQGVLLAAPNQLPPQVAHLSAFVRKIESMSRQLNRSRLEVVVGWARSNPSLSGVVLGAESESDLYGVIQAFAEEPLGEQELAALAELPQPDAELSDPRFWSTSSRAWEPPDIWRTDN